MASEVEHGVLACSVYFWSFTSIVFFSTGLFRLYRVRAHLFRYVAVRGVCVVFLTSLLNFVSRYSPQPRPAGLSDCREIVSHSFDCNLIRQSMSSKFTSMSLILQLLFSYLHE
jgi:hypothetical protein